MYKENNKYNTIFNYKYDNSNNLIQREIIMYHSDGKILGKAIIFSVIIIFLYSSVEIFYLSGNITSI